MPSRMGFTDAEGQIRWLLDPCPITGAAVRIVSVARTAGTGFDSRIRGFRDSRTGEELESVFGDRCNKQHSEADNKCLYHYCLQYRRPFPQEE